jgi:probable addiction module antidote protein
MNVSKLSREVDLLAILQDSGKAAEYLNNAIESGDRMRFLVAMRDIVIARGGISAVAEQSSLSRSSLYKSLSRQGNPEFKSITSLLDSLGLKLSVAPANRGT